MKVSIYIISILIGLNLLLFGVLLLKGRNGQKNHILRSFSVYLILLTILSFFAYTAYTDYLLRKEIINLQRANDSLIISQNTVDSLLAKEGGKDFLIDSLTRKNHDMEKLLNNVRSYQRIAGSGSNIPIIERTQAEIQQTELVIKNAESYNEIYPKSEVKDGLSKGYSFSGETNYFTFYPPVETEGSYLDFSLKFVDDKLVDKIAVIYIEVDYVDDDGSYHILSSSFYKPQEGMNRFKIHNYLRKKGSFMMVGFFWKNEFGLKDTPRYEKTTFVVNQ